MIYRSTVWHVVNVFYLLTCFQPSFHRILHVKLVSTRVTCCRHTLESTFSPTNDFHTSVFPAWDKRSCDSYDSWNPFLISTRVSQTGPKLQFDWGWCPQHNWDLKSTSTQLGPQVNKYTTGTSSQQVHNWDLKSTNTQLGPKVNKYTTGT